MHSRRGRSFGHTRIRRIPAVVDHLNRDACRLETVELHVVQTGGPVMYVVARAAQQSSTRRSVADLLVSSKAMSYSVEFTIGVKTESSTRHAPKEQQIDLVEQPQIGCPRNHCSHSMR